MTRQATKIALGAVAALVLAFIAAATGILIGRARQEPAPAASRAAPKGEADAEAASRAMTFTQPKAPAQ